MNRPALQVTLGFAIALVARLALITVVDTNYSFDGYQRWAGRDHVLVQDWLPATQSMIWIVTKLGGGIIAVRVVLAVVAAVAVAAGTVVAQILGGQEAGWFFIPVGVFGPFLAWSVVPYLEGVFLLLVLGSLALALRAQQSGATPGSGAWWMADLVAGGVALVRYEGWPFVVLYILWRRDPRSLLAIWGMALWLVIRTTGIEGYAASPIDFADWNGLTARFSWAQYAESLQKFVGQTGSSHGWALGALGVAGCIGCIRSRRPGSVLLLCLVLTQFAAVAGWMAGLETSTYRMQSVLGVLMGVFAAAWAGSRWRSGQRLIHAGLLCLVCLAIGLFTAEGFSEARRSIRSIRWERTLIQEMGQCADCTWEIHPRKGIGTRDRHDGCEIVQGISPLRHGVDFRCVGWPQFEALTPNRRAVWQRGGYRIETL